MVGGRDGRDGRRWWTFTRRFGSWRWWFNLAQVTKTSRVNEPVVYTRRSRLLEGASTSRAQQVVVEDVEEDDEDEEFEEYFDDIWRIHFDDDLLHFKFEFSYNSSIFELWILRCDVVNLLYIWILRF